MHRLMEMMRSRPPIGTAPLVAGTGLLAVGKGVFLSTLVVYLLQIVRVDAVSASLCGTVLGLAALLFAVPAGWMVDHLSAQRVGIAASFCAIPAVALAGTVHHLAPLLAVLFCFGAADATAGVARRAMLAARPGAGVAALSWARAASNGGFAIGAILSVPLLAARSADAYRLAYTAAGLSYAMIVVAIYATRTNGQVAANAPAVDFEVKTEPSATSRPFTTAALLAGSTAMLSLHDTLLDIGFPIWIVKHTSMPVSDLGWLILINTLLTVFGQVAAGRHAQTLDGALRALTRSALWVAACCGLLAASTVGPTAYQVAMLALAMIALTVGELLQSAGEWGLSALLAGEAEHGRFQGACVLGESAQNSGGPLVVGALLGSFPVVGCGVLVVLLIAGRAVTRRLASTINQEPELAQGARMGLHASM